MARNGQRLSNISRFSKQSGRRDVTTLLCRPSTGIPVLHSGSHFRHGLLQLMIHTIDPLHDGRVTNILIFLQQFYKIHILAWPVLAIIGQVKSHPLCNREKRLSKHFIFFRKIYFRFYFRLFCSYRIAFIKMVLSSGFSVYFYSVDYFFKI